MLKNKVICIFKTLNEKEIHIRDIFLLFLIVLCLGFGVIYTSFAIFTNTIDKNNVASLVLETPTYSLTSTSAIFNNDTKQVLVDPYGEVNITLNVESSASNLTKYKVYYEGVQPTTLTDKVIVGVNSYSESAKTDIINNGNNNAKTIDLEILNNTSETVILKFGVAGGYVNNDVDLIENQHELIQFGETTEITRKSNTSNLGLKNSTGNDLTNYKIFGHSEQNALPSIYQEVEYIESTGTQYINTGFVPTVNTKVEMDSQLTFISTGYTFLFGSRKSTEDINGRFDFVKGTNNVLNFNIGNNSSIRTNPNTITADTNRHIYVADGMNKQSLIDGTACTEYVGDYSTFESSDIPLLLFGTTYGGSLQTNYLAKMKLYNTKIWDNNILIRNMIPCYRKYDSVIGLYDIVNNVFYPNNGTGNFGKGDNVESTSIVASPSTPIDIKSLGESKNIYNQKAQNKNVKGVDFIFTNNDITMNGTATSDGGRLNFLYNSIKLKAGVTYSLVAYYISGECTNNSINVHLSNTSTFLSVVSKAVTKTNTIRTFTPETDMTVQFGINVGTGFVYDNWKFSFAIYEGNYINIPQYKPYRYIDITSSGKNILKVPTGTVTNAGLTVTSDEQNISMNGTVSTSYAYIKISGETLVLETSVNDILKYYNEPIVMKANQQYTLKIYNNNTTTRFIYMTYSDGTRTNYAGRNDETYNITPAKDVSAIFVQYANGTSLNQSINEQIELGSVATEYEVNKQITTTIDLSGHEPLRKIGDVADYIDYKKGVIVRNIGKHIFTGEEIGGIQGPGIAMRINLSDAKIPATVGGYMSLSNMYLNTNTYNKIFNGTIDNSFILSSLYFGSQGSITIRDSRYTIWTDYATNLQKLYNAGIPLIAYYPLQTPVEEPITLPSIPTYEGTTIFNVQNGNLELTYQRNT